ncbi:hypothetical protein F0562_008379 [Nyssa sinensis]|uniref:Uncharacterized protein n=1 Tax=Nyssa sinensis TaxID=561372 RepID=A0A5J5A8S5_9ASTE|nr:hypothetical protein F0562_008379 [Nyssa sinensis]
MGCCLSTNKAPETNPDAVPANHHHHLLESETKGRDLHSLRAPPPQPEEEIVKEVLSETPIPKPPTPTLIKHDNKPPEVPEVKIEATTAIKPTEDIISQVSEVSEMCSFSESLSTTTLTEKREDDGEVTQRVQKSPSEGPQKTAGRNVRPPNRLRRDPGESFCRRSRSPVTRGEPGPPRTVNHKNPNSSTTNRSPAGTAENGGKLENLEKPNDDVSPETGESLENPLVSMECFIFL